MYLPVAVAVLAAMGLMVFLIWQKFAQRKADQKKADEEFFYIYGFCALPLRNMWFTSLRTDPLRGKLSVFHGNPRDPDACGLVLSISEGFQVLIDTLRGYNRGEDSGVILVGWKCRVHGIVDFDQRWVRRTGFSLAQEERLNDRLQQEHILEVEYHRKLADIFAPFAERFGWSPSRKLS